MAKELTLDEQIEEGLKAVEAPEVEEKEEVEQEETEEPEVKEDSEEETKEEPKEEPKPEVKTEVKPTIDPEIAYQLREARRREALLNEKVAELSAPKKEVKAIPDPNEDPVGWLAHKTAELEEKQRKIDEYVETQEREKQSTQQYEAAKAELTGYAQRFATANPDFQQVAVHVENEIAKHIKAENPGITPQMLTKMVDHKVLSMAGQAVRNNTDPASYIYMVGKEVYGYKPAPKEEPKPDPTKKPDLKVVDKNRKKSANGLSGSSGKSGVSIKDLENMSIDEIEQDEEAKALMGW